MAYDITMLLDNLFSTSEIAGDTTWSAPTPIAGEFLPMNWRIEYEERAGILEYDGKMSRVRAEDEALKETLRQMRAAGD
jgi:hypothetical protein